MNETMQRQIDVCQRGAVVAAVTGGLLSVLGAWLQRHEFFIAWLFAWLFWIGLSLGCFLVSMIHHLTAGRWGEASRRFLEAGFAPLLAMAILMAPLLFGLRELYPWARPEQVASDIVLQKRGSYASVWGFIIRSGVLLAIWVWMANRLRKWSLQQDSTSDLTATIKLRRLSGAGVVIYPLTATFAYVDWLLSIEPRWYSTMFPIIVCIGQILAAVSFAILGVAWRERSDSLEALTDPKILRQLGNLLLAFVLFWTYVSFGQLLIIYSGNLPAEIDWYLHRVGGSWKLVIAVIALFHFFVPFYALLFRGVTRRIGRLAFIAALVFVTCIADVFWDVVPTFYPIGIHIDWVDVVVFAGLGGTWLAIFCASLKRHPLTPRNDPRFHKEIVAHAA